MSKFTQIKPGEMPCTPGSTAAASTTGCGIRQLTAAEASCSLVNRLGPMVDRVRQIGVRLGIRPYNVWLVWTKWTGAERGEGREIVMHRIPVVPNPKVEDLSSVTLNPFSAGILPVGTVRLSEISVQYTVDQMLGKWCPKAHEDQIPEPWNFFWEIVEDGRGDDPAARNKYRPLSVPFRKADSVQFTILLERVSEDLDRQGRPQDLMNAADADKCGGC